MTIPLPTIALHQTFPEERMKLPAIATIWISSMLVSRMDAAISIYSSRTALLNEGYTIAATENFSTSTVGTLIGNTPSTEFVSGPFTISSSSSLNAGPFRAQIAGGGHPDNSDGSVFASLETFGSSHPNQELRNDSASILLSGQHHLLGFDLGSFAEQTSAIFHTNLGNTVSITGAGPIGSKIFAGVLSSNPGEFFTRVDFLITGASTASDGFGVDNLVAGTIPEPSGVLLAASTLGIFLLKRRR
jgi:hypothetical protein